MIETNNLKKMFGKVTAVDGLSFSARDGAITTVLGGNGAGKTTAFRMIAGLIKPDAGYVLIDGADVARERVKAVSQLGLLHDEFGLYPRLTAREHLAFAGALHGLGGRRLRDAVERTIELLVVDPADPAGPDRSRDHPAGRVLVIPLAASNYWLTTILLPFLIYRWRRSGSTS